MSERGLDDELLELRGQFIDSFIAHQKAVDGQYVASQQAFASDRFPAYWDARGRESLDRLGVNDDDDSEGGSGTAGGGSEPRGDSGGGDARGGESRGPAGPQEDAE